MDFSRVTSIIGSYLDALEQPWALIGGLGLAAYGLERFTLDLDLAVPAHTQEGLVTFLTEQGYELLHRSRGFSCHLHPDPDLGRVDLMYLRGDTQERVFAARQFIHGVFEKPIPVAAPGHLVAMKAQALAEDPSRHSDLSDVRFLLRLPEVDRADARKAFAKRGLGKLYDDLESSL
jgi:hypothetical protein